MAVSIKTKAFLSGTWQFDENDEIIGGCGLIQNNFVDRTDLFPYLCALFVEEKARGNALGAKLLENARIDAGRQTLISYIFVLIIPHIMKNMAGNILPQDIIPGVKHQGYMKLWLSNNLAEKAGLYTKIHKALRSKGMYIECDYMVTDQSVEDKLFAENARLRREMNIQDGEFYHFDTPCTIDNQIAMLKKAGFSSVEMV